MDAGLTKVAKHKPSPKFSHTLTMTASTSYFSCIDSYCPFGASVKVIHSRSKKAAKLKDVTDSNL
jgi:hypothetical protein